MIEKIAEQLPDIWFDWYARLMPGCFGLGLYLVLSSKVPASPTDAQVVLFVMGGYLVGHALQPASSFVTKLIEKIWGRDQNYAEAKGADTPIATLNKVSKAHAEATSMAAFTIALLINLLLRFFESPKLHKGIALGALLYFAAATFERAWARSRKIKDLGGLPKIIA